MVFFKSNIPQDVFAGSAAQWARLQDRQAFGAPPHSSNVNEQYGCRVIKDFTSYDNIKYRRGMQGHALRFTKNPKGVDIALVFIQGVTESGPGPGEQYKWIPRDWIEVGARWRDSIKDWPISIEGALGTGSAHWQPPTGSGERKLDKTLFQLLKAFLTQSVSSGICGNKVVELAEKHGIQNLTEMILKGITEAGLYDALNNENCTLEDLYAASNWKIDNTRGGGKFGIYARYVKSGSSTSLEEAKQWYLYVGQTQDDFSRRHQTHSQTHAGRFAALVRASTSSRMFALCVFHEITPTFLYFLAEQAFVCLLATYSSYLFLAQPASQMNLQLSDKEAAITISGIARNVFQSTGWKPFNKRNDPLQFRGANTRSPLQESREKGERLLWIRTDVVFKDFQTGESYTMAEFRRGTSKRAHWQKATTGSHYLKLYRQDMVSSDKKFDFCISDTSTTPDGPLQNSPLHTVLEFRLDGKPHPKCWARLPLVGPFENFDQANSFAVRYEWEYPKGSGTWRVRYMQGPDTPKIIDSRVSGSQRRYALAMAILMRFFGHSKKNVPEWVFRPTSDARVLQAHLNYMEQSIQLKQQDKPELKSFRRRSAEVLTSMLLGYGLGMKFEDVNLVKARWRADRDRCDFCQLLTHVGPSYQDFSGSCEREGKTCSNCSRWGLPCCTWTPFLPSKLTVQERVRYNLYPNELEKFNHVTKVLLAFPRHEPTEIKTYQNELLYLPTDEIIDESDSEEEANAVSDLNLE